MPCHACSLHAHAAAFSHGGAFVCRLSWAGALVSHGTSACASTAPCMLYMMRGTFCLNALPCRLSGTAILPCLALLRAACSYSCGRLILWGSHISSWIVLTSLGQRLMIMMMVTRTQTHLHQPWWLDRCNNSFIKFFDNTCQFYAIYTATSSKADTPLVMMCSNVQARTNNSCTGCMNIISS